MMYIRLLYVLSDCSGQQKVSAKVRTKVFSVDDSILLFDDDVEDGSIRNNIKNDSKNNLMNNININLKNNSKNNSKNKNKNKIHGELSIFSETNQIFFISKEIICLAQYDNLR